MCVHGGEGGREAKLLHTWVFRVALAVTKSWRRGGMEGSSNLAARAAAHWRNILATRVVVFPVVGGQGSGWGRKSTD